MNQLVYLFVISNTINETHRDEFKFGFNLIIQSKIISNPEPILTLNPKKGKNAHGIHSYRFNLL